MRMNLPEAIRVPVLKGYAWVTAIDMSEAGEAIETYHNINELFTRSLKPGLRPLENCSIVSPCDSRVLSFGEVHGTTLNSIKGQDYNLVFFFTGSKNLQAEEYVEGLKKKKENKLYYVTFYLSPADHHRFYAPFDWVVRYRRHLYGYLLGVFPLNLRRRKDIYEVNERVVYFGEWEQGFAAFVAVGAYNVGSMQINIDPELATNKSSFPNPLALFEQKEFSPEVSVSKGTEFGRFNTGSTIVLLFEAPPGLEFALTERGKVKIGSGLLRPSGH